MSFLSSIGRLFKKLWDAIRKILAIILIIIAVILIVWAAIFSGGAALVLFGFAISQTAAFVLAALALTGAFLIDSETSKEVVGKIGEAMGEAAQSVGQVVGDIAGGGISGLLGSNGGMLLVGGIALYFILSSGSNSRDRKEGRANAIKNGKAGNPKGDKSAVGGTVVGTSVKASPKSATVTKSGSKPSSKEVRDQYGSIPLFA